MVWLLERPEPLANMFRYVRPLSVIAGLRRHDADRHRDRGQDQDQKHRPNVPNEIHGVTQPIAKEPKNNTSGHRCMPSWERIRGENAIDSSTIHIAAAWQSGTSAAPRE